MSPTEIANSLEAAEQALRGKQYGEALKSIRPVLDDLQGNGDSKGSYECAILLKLASVLRDIGNNGDDDSNAYDDAEMILNQASDWYQDKVEVLLERAWLDYDRERFDKALASFQLIIKTVPLTNDNKVLALQGAGASLRRLYCFAEAEEVLAETVGAGGTVPTKTLVERGWLYFYQQNFGRAWADFEAAAGRSDISEKDKTRVMTGQIAVRQIEDAQNTESERSSAEELLNSWLEGTTRLAPADAVNIAYGAAKIHLYLNNCPAALLAINLVMKHDSTNEKYFAFKIDVLIWLRRFAEAEKLYLDTQETFPDSIRLRFEMGLSCYVQKRYQEALCYFDFQTLQSALAKDETKEELLNNLKNDENSNEWTIVVLRKMYRVKEAEKRVEEALARFGYTANLLSEKAVIHFSKQEYNEAIKIFDRVLRIDGYNVFAHQWRAAAFRKQGKYKEAEEGIREALKKLESPAMLWEEMAWLYFDQNELEKADECFAKSIELDPYFLRRQFSRVEVLSRLNRNDAAREILLKLRSQFPDDLEVAEQLGWFYLRRHELEHARKEFEFIKNKAQEHVLGNNGMGGYFLECREYVAAAKAFRLALKAVNYEPQYHINLAWALMRQVKEPGEMNKSDHATRKRLLDAATKRCQKALGLDAYNATAYSCLGVIAFKKNYLLDAEGYFRQSLKLNPQGDSHVDLGVLYVQMGRYKEAEKEFAEAININRNDARAHVELANLLLLTENNQEALQECREAVAIDPDSAEAHQALAIGLMRSGQFEEAEAVLRRAISVARNTEQWKLHLLLSQILIRRGDDNNKEQTLYNEALKHINNAKRINLTGHSDIYFHAGIVDARLGDYRSAQRNFKRCLEINCERFEAEHYSRLVRNMIREDRRVSRLNIWGGLVLAAICVLLLTTLTVFYYTGKTRAVPESEVAAANNENRTKSVGFPVEKVNVGEQLARANKQKRELIVDKSLLTFMTPLLIGLLVVALLLPNLNKLKLPGGFEAELSEVKTKETISTGPKGEIGFGSSLPIISPGPSGQPRSGGR